MNALDIKPERRQLREPRQRPVDLPMACGWCKGFIHEEIVSTMRRWVHDEAPATNHEVLPFRFTTSWTGRG